jgi:hypothetical protein
LKCDAVVYTRHDELLLLSVVGPSTAIKAAKALLADGPKRVRIRKNYQKYKPLAEGYRCAFHKLEFGNVHLLAVAKIPSLVCPMTEDALWRMLTTSPHRGRSPMLRHWMPWIYEQLEEGYPQLLRKAYCYGCDVGTLIADVPEVDEIISRGVRSGVLKLELPEKEAACA